MPESQGICAICRQNVLNPKGQFIVRFQNIEGTRGTMDFHNDIKFKSTTRYVLLVTVCTMLIFHFHRIIPRSERSTLWWQ